MYSRLRFKVRGDSPYLASIGTISSTVSSIFYQLCVSWPLNMWSIYWSLYEVYNRCQKISCVHLKIPVYTVLITDILYTPSTFVLVCLFTVFCSNPNPTISCLEKNSILNLAPLKVSFLYSASVSFLTTVTYSFWGLDLDTDFSKKKKNLNDWTESQYRREFDQASARSTDFISFGIEK